MVYNRPRMQPPGPGPAAARLVYLDQDGARRKSLPADVKESDAGTLTALRGDVAAIRKTIAGERSRLDGLMALDRRWPIAEWRSLYLGHPVTGPLARALVWGFRGGDGTSVVVGVKPPRTRCGCPRKRRALPSISLRAGTG